MPPVRRDELARHPGLARALRWLRHRRRLTQGELRDAVIAGGGTVSVIYIQQLEAGAKRPSPAMLDALLAALGSGRDELAGLLAHEPWDAAPPSAYRPRRDAPKPAIPSAIRGTAWSDPVARGEAFAGPPAPARRAAADALAGQLAELEDHFANLSPEARETLLGQARRARFGSGR